SGSLAELGADDGFLPPDVAKRVPGIPAELAAAVNACLSRRPEDRPSSAAALARMLAPVASEADTLSLPVDPAQRATEILALPSAQAPRRRMRRRLVAVAALVAAAAAGLAVALVLNPGGKAPHRAPTQRAAAVPAAPCVPSAVRRRPAASTASSPSTRRGLRPGRAPARASRRLRRSTSCGTAPLHPGAQPPIRAGPRPPACFLRDRSR